MVKKNKVQKDYFPVLRKLRFLYYFETVLKSLAFNASTIMSYVMRTKNIKLKNIKSISFYPWTYCEVAPLLIKVLTSQV